MSESRRLGPEKSISELLYIVRRNRPLDVELLSIFGSWAIFKVLHLDLKAKLIGDRFLSSFVQPLFWEEIHHPQSVSVGTGCFPLGAGAPDHSISPCCHSLLTHASFVVIYSLMLNGVNFYSVYAELGTEDGFLCNPCCGFSCSFKAQAESRIVELCLVFHAPFGVRLTAISTAYAPSVRFIRSRPWPIVSSSEVDKNAGRPLLLTLVSANSS